MSPLCLEITPNKRQCTCQYRGLFVVRCLCVQEIAAGRQATSRLLTKYRASPVASASKNRTFSLHQACKKAGSSEHMSYPAEAVFSAKKSKK